jgi:hypothetical protein
MGICDQSQHILQRLVLNNDEKLQDLDEAVFSCRPSVGGLHRHAVYKLYDSHNSMVMERKAKLNALDESVIHAATFP